MLYQCLWGASKKEFPSLYRDFIRDHGAPSILRRDNALEENSAQVDEIHRELYIKDQFSEPHNQQQNPVESLAIRSLSQHVYVLLDRTRAPDAAWYLAAAYLADVHNHLSNDNLPNKISPIQFRTGVTPDISPFLQYTFWQPILYLDHESSWPSTTERPGYWVGIAHNIGDILTYWIYDDQTKHVLARSVIRPLHIHSNQHVNWDPIFAGNKSKKSAQHGGISDLLQQSFKICWIILKTLMTK